MTVRKPLVRYGGRIRQLGAGDYVPASAIYAAAVEPANSYSMPAGSVQAILAGVYEDTGWMQEWQGWHTSGVDGSAHTATSISNTPAGGITETNVQAALNGLDTGKLAKSGDTMAGPLTINRSSETSVSAYALHVKASGGVSNAGRFLLSQGSAYGLALSPLFTGTASARCDFQWVDIATGSLESTPISTIRSGLVGIGKTPTIGNGALQVNGGIEATGLTALAGPIGYGTGAGGSVTQDASKSTAVTLNKPCGRIQMHSASLAACASVEFAFNNSTISPADGLVVNPDGFTGYAVEVAYFNTSTQVVLRVTNKGATRSDALNIVFRVFKGALS